MGVVNPGSMFYPSPRTAISGKRQRKAEKPDTGYPLHMH